MTPVVIEVAINGATTRERNPHVPLSLEEIVASVDACVAAGASVVHMHAGAPVVGGAQRHPPEPYVEAFRACLARHPGLLMYPTLSGGGPGTAIAERYAHLEALRAAGLLRLAPIDPGTMNYGVRDAAGAPPAHDAVYVNTFGDVDGAFRHCRAHGLGCTMSIFEPGFLQLVLAHRDAGSLPSASILKFEFAAGRRLFGMPPRPESLAAYLAMLGPQALPWMVAVRDGDAGATLAREAIVRGGHVRVGIEDYGGPRRPRNDELVAEVAAIAHDAGRRPATPAEAAAIIGLGS